MGNQIKNKPQHMSSDLVLQEIPIAERNNRQKPEEDKE